MHCRLDQLNCCVVSNIDCKIGWKRNLGETEGSRIWILAGADNLHAIEHDIRHVRRICAKAQIDVDEGSSVSLEPSRLECDGTAFQRPLGAVCRGGHSAACVGQQLSISSRGQKRPYKDTSIAFHMDKGNLVHQRIVPSHPSQLRCHSNADCLLSSQDM